MITDKCDPITNCHPVTEFCCTVWRNSITTVGNDTHWFCPGCAEGIAHEYTMKLPHELDLRVPRYAPIDGQTGGR